MDLHGNRSVEKRLKIHGGLFPGDPAIELGVCFRHD
jgi:hypothetical protein